GRRIRGGLGTPAPGAHVRLRAPGPAHGLSLHGARGRSHGAHRPHRPLRGAVARRPRGRRRGAGDARRRASRRARVHADQRGRAPAQFDRACPRPGAARARDGRAHREPGFRESGPGAHPDRDLGSPRDRHHLLHARSRSGVSLRAPRGALEPGPPGRPRHAGGRDHPRAPRRHLRGQRGDRAGRGAGGRPHPRLRAVARPPGGILMAAMSPELVAALSLSGQGALAATLLTALVGIPIAYVLARRRFWGHGLLDLLVTLPLVLPPTVTGYYLIVLLGRRGVLGRPIYEVTGWSIAFTWYAAVVAATV